MPTKTNITLRYYSANHHWVEVEGEKIARIGLTQNGVKEVGEIVFIQLPQAGIFLKKDDEMVIIESTKAAIDLYAPISGRIIEINQLLQTEPESINLDAENKAWMIKMELSAVEEIAQLLSLQQYQKLINL